MINLKTERVAVHNCASIFSDFGWVFREQAIGDFGIDALVETTVNGKPTGKLIALQIKGGNSNFHETDSSLTFYFSDTHRLYWSNYTLPVFLILQDSNNQMFWQVFSTDKVQKTRTRFKIDIPKTNILKDSKKLIDTISAKKLGERKNDFLEKSSIENNGIFKYFLGENSSLCVSVNIGKKSINFDFDYNPKKNWDHKLEKLNNEDPYYNSLESFENIITEEIYKKREDIELNILKMIGGNIQNLTANIFNLRNRNYEIPEYFKFIEAFENYSKLDKSKYKVIIIEDLIKIKTNKKSYEIHTFESRKKRIQYYIENRLYEEIHVFTDFSAWSEAYRDYGISKHQFIPVFLREWDYYWEHKYEISEKLNTPRNYIDELKNNHLIKLDKFSDLYNETKDVIELAFDFDYEVFYPIAIITMHTILGSDILSLYSEFELEDEEWIEISKINNENHEDWEYEPTFYLKELYI